LIWQDIESIETTSQAGGAQTSLAEKSGKKVSARVGFPDLLVPLVDGGPDSRVLSVMLATGAFAGDDELAGPLADFVWPSLAHAPAEIHEGLASVLLALIGLHVAGILVDMVLTRDNLVRAMWTGYKMVPGEDADSGAPAAALSWRAVLALAGAAGVAWVVATL
jgi:hypothetical protein